MKVLHSISDLSGVRGPVFLAIGVFDGVHLGHQAVIERAARDATATGGTAVAVTFDPHPMRVLRPGNTPRLLTATQHKIRLIKALGVSHLLVIPFDAAFAATPPREFILDLHRACKPLREICVGHQWSFGKNRAGNLELLKTLGDQLEFDEIGIPAVEVDGRVVSSTLIRSAVEGGDLKTAARLLGREYTILGTVMEGMHLGEQIGFPTANLSAHNEQFPPDGVYAAEAVVDGKKIPGVLNIGMRPTLDEKDPQRLLEVHLFNFQGSLYGREMEVFFRQYLRPEKKFPSLGDLKAQIARDCETARALVSTRPPF